MKKVVSAVLVMVLFETVFYSSGLIAQPEGTTSSSVAIMPIRSQWPIVREASGQWVILGEAVFQNGGIETIKIDAISLRVYNANDDVLADKIYVHKDFRKMLLIQAINQDGNSTQKPAGARILDSGDEGFGFVATRVNSPLTPVRARVTLQFQHGDSVAADIPLYEYDPGQQTIWPLTFTGGDWIAYNTVGDYYHWKEIPWKKISAPAAGEYFISQRFAIDALQFDQQGNTSEPANSRNKEDYYAWGEDILSSGPGVVVAVERNIPDQEIGVQDSVNLLGNFVVIQHAPNLYSLYVHMMQNSAIVNAGDHVVAGQMIGRVGNSGQTDQPHLHFQYVDAWKESPAPLVNSFWESQGLPALFWNVKINRLSTEKLRRLLGRLPARWDPQVNLKGGTFMLNGSMLFTMDIVTTP